MFHVVNSFFFFVQLTAVSQARPEVLGKVRAHGREQQHLHLHEAEHERLVHQGRRLCAPIPAEREHMAHT